MVLSVRLDSTDSWVRKIPWRRDRLPTPAFLDFPGGSTGKESPATRETWAQSPGWENPLEEAKAPHTPVFWPGEFHGWRSLGGYSPRGHKELDTTEQLSLSTATRKKPQEHGREEAVLRREQ